MLYNYCIILKNNIMMAVQKNFYFVKANTAERISVIQFLMQEKRVVYFHGKKSFAEYLEHKYPEYYKDYIENKIFYSEINLFIFIIKLKTEGEIKSIKARVYENTSTDQNIRAVKLFTRFEYPNGFDIIIPLDEIESLTL